MKIIDTNLEDINWRTVFFFRSKGLNVLNANVLKKEPLFNMIACQGVEPLRCNNRTGFCSLDIFNEKLKLKVKSHIYMYLY